MDRLHTTSSRWLRRALLLLALATAPAIWCPAADAAANSPWAESYIDTGDIAEIYGTAQDAIGLDTANKLLLEMTNDVRRRAGLSVLAWDDLAAAAAQLHAAEMARERYPGHYNLAGQKCELRFNLLGGTDHVSENYAYYEIAHPIHLAPQLVARMMQHWLDSPAHSALILGGEHTGLGCGFALQHEAGVTYAASVVEFVNDYGDHSRLPRRATAGDALLISGNVAPGQARFAYIGVGIEPLPTERDTAYQREHAGGYRTPAVLLALAPRDMLGYRQPPAPERRYVVQYDEATGDYAVELTLLPGCLKGAYYITTWVEPWTSGDTPFDTEFCCAMTQVVLVE